MITDEPDRAEEHRLRMQRRKARVDARVAAATQDRGVLLVLTGSGKGKSSSAFGMLAARNRSICCSLIDPGPEPRISRGGAKGKSTV